MKQKLSKVNLQTGGKFLWLKRINSKIGDHSPLPLYSVIKILNPRSDVFLYEGEYYHINDFESITILDDSNNELIESDYDYINFNDLSTLQNIFEYETVITSKDIREIGCPIKRLYDDTHIIGVVVEKEKEDYRNDSENGTFAYRYYLPNGSLSGVKMATISSKEWVSTGVKTVFKLKPIEKVKFLLTDENSDCQETLSKIRQIVFNKR